MKSGLMVLVDLFSLVSMTLFSVFIIVQEVQSTQTGIQSNDYIYEISIVPSDASSELSSYFGHRPSLSELITVKPRLGVNGEDTKYFDDNSRGLLVSHSPDSIRVFVSGEVKFDFLSLAVVRIAHPIALTVPFNVTIQEQSPNAANAKSFSNVQWGRWDDVTIRRN